MSTTGQHIHPEIEDHLFRPMQEADMPFVLAIEHKAYEFPWTKGVFKDCLEASNHCRIIERAGVIIGYGIMSVAAGESHILNICVTPEMRRQGLGRSFLAYFIDEARNAKVDIMLLEVRPSNKAALELYEQAGFNEIGMRKAYYPAANGKEDAIILARAL